MIPVSSTSTSNFIAWESFRHFLPMVQLVLAVKKGASDASSLHLPRVASPQLYKAMNYV